jgi:hypothetical protein
MMLATQTVTVKGTGCGKESNQGYTHDVVYPLLQYFGGSAAVARCPGCHQLPQLEEMRASGHLGADPVLVCTVPVVERPLYPEHQRLGDFAGELDGLYGGSLRLCTDPIVCLPRLVAARPLKGGVRAQNFSHLFYDGQADGLTLEVFWLVFWCFSSARLASIRLSLALS